MNFIIISGISGAGKSQTVKFLEDLGFFCVDNLPPALIPKFADFCYQSGGKLEKIALVIDIRGGELLKDLVPSLESLKELGFSYEILFLEASDQVLIKRFKESRRMHPLSQEGRLIEGIAKERTLLKEIKKKATHIIDTSNLSTKQLRDEIEAIFVEGKKFEGMILNIISFGFKYGIPIECDLIFDVRFIPNPYYIPTMKKLSGIDEPVKVFVIEMPETKEFLERILNLLEFLIPNYVKEGKSQLVIGIGCTGGRHRSVAIANRIQALLSEKQHYTVVDHRDIEKDGRGAKK